MNQEHNHNHHVQDKEAVKPLKIEAGITALAISATFHCLLGCGIGEVAGMVISAWLLLNNLQSVILSVILGFIAGLALGIVPFIKRKMRIADAIKLVIVGEGISIAVMELFEVLTQILIPGVMEAHLHQPLFWMGMLASLVAGFFAALPVNMVMIRKGIRHSH